MKIYTYYKDFWHVLTKGGYIRPKATIEEKERIAKLVAAIYAERFFEHVIDDQKEADVIEFLVWFK